MSRFGVGSEETQNKQKQKNAKSVARTLYPAAVTLPNVETRTPKIAGGLYTGQWLECRGLV